MLKLFHIPRNTTKRILPWLGELRAYSLCGEAEVSSHRSFANGYCMIILLIYFLSLLLQLYVHF